MNPPAQFVWLHRFAWLIAALTLLLPVTTGAVVTTLQAGMVFADWPSSDGHNMLAYPWLTSARDEFVEHGHRLAGMTLGLLSLALTIFAWCTDRRPQVRIIATAILVAVIAQGMLGGARVLLNKQVMALLHGDFAALVFTLTAILTLVTSRGWEERSRLTSVGESQLVTSSALILLMALMAQYLMGGFLRHLRESADFAWAWMVHPWFAIVVLVAMLIFVGASRRTASMLVRRCAWSLLSLTVAQSLVGLATWYVKYGVPSWGVVAQQDSLPQIIVCSLHKVLGMTTLMTSGLALFCCWATRPLSHDRQPMTTLQTSVAGATL